MAIIERVKSHLERNIPVYLAAWVIYAIPTVGWAVFNNMREQSRLANAADMVCKQGLNLYGFDEDGDGSIDRIEEVDITPYRAMPILIRKTFREGDTDWNHQHRRLFANGTKTD